MTNRRAVGWGLPHRLAYNLSNPVNIYATFSLTGKRDEQATLTILLRAKPLRVVTQAAYYTSMEIDTEICEPTTTQAADILREVFGYNSFRPQQEEIVRHVTDGGNALVLMPTGGGKSLCYQIPALLRHGTGIVVSPLIALMRDQVDALRQAGVRAAYWNSSLSAAEAAEVRSALRAGELDLLYVAPERLLLPQTLALLKELPIALIAIDEAHCVSQWGHDFRAEYLQLSQLATHFPEVPRLALTATADDLTRREIIDKLSLAEGAHFITGFDRPNIRYRIQLKDNPRRQLLDFLNNEHADDAGIVYCFTRKRVDATAAWLRDAGWNALPYHAGLNARQRQDNQDRFLREDGIVMVATVAFGMGINKPDVRFVAHFDMPKSVEAYYQETGRAGRDGLPANAWMLYGLQDVVQLRQLLASSDANEERKRIEQQKLDALAGLCEIASCRRRVLLRYFGEEMAEDCGNCDTCLTPVAVWDGTVAAQKALSNVYHTGQRFGAMHLVDVLLGKRNEKIERFGHDRLSTYGIGDELDAFGWASVYRQLTARGFLAPDAERFGGLRLTRAAKPVLRGDETVSLRRDIKVKRQGGKTTRDKNGKGKSSRKKNAPPVAAEDIPLWEALRGLRMELSQTQKIPPYAIFHDTTLRGMVAMRPDSLDEMAEISGIGSQKLKRYGHAFLQVVREN